MLEYGSFKQIQEVLERQHWVLRRGKGGHRVCVREREAGSKQSDQSIHRPTAVDLDLPSLLAARLPANLLQLPQPRTEKAARPR
jgi:hypothetical protein